MVGSSTFGNDAIFTEKDCNIWNVDWANGTCVGGGEGSITIGEVSTFYLGGFSSVPSGDFVRPFMYNQE